MKNNLVQIVNYDLYLKNINTKYIIEFANNIVLEIYNIFKKNIDYWLSTNNSNAYILSNKLIENNITDREIYTYMCVYGVINKKINIIHKYINDSKPYSKNYSCLIKYF